VINDFFRIENFLEPEKNSEILNWAQENQYEFISSTVSTGVEDYRRSDVAFRFPLISTFKSRIRTIIPPVLAALGLEMICMGDVESQLTATGDGGFFKAHTDRGVTTPNRIISYVYYLHSIPKPFTGGELRLYESRDSSKFKVIEPTNNSLVLFKSDCWHEVMPVQNSEKFADSRFTINGWVNEYDDLTQPSLLIA
jgi:SM-20-related protein